MKCLPSLAPKEIQIKRTLKFHFSPGRMAIIKKTNTNPGNEVGGKIEPLHTVSKDVN
jgi:hypothetical protein